MKTLHNIIIITLSLLLFLPVGEIFANTYREFGWVSTVVDDTILYYDESRGEVIQKNVMTGEGQPLFTNIPSPEDTFQYFSQNNLLEDRSVLYDTPLQISFSPDQKRMLINALNEPFDIGTTSYPFWNEEVNQETLWWIYNFDTQEATPLSSLFNHVGWYSDTEIIYVFDEREIAVAPIDNPSNFRILTSDITGIPDPLKPIQANETRQIIPLDSGYLIGNQGTFRFRPVFDQDFSIQTLLNQDTFVLAQGTEATLLNWDNEVVQTFQDLKPVSKTLIMSNNTLLLLQQDGTLIQYAEDGTISRLNIPEASVNDIWYAGQELPGQVLIFQEGQVILYDTESQKINTTLIQNPEQGVDETAQLEQVSTDFPLQPLIIALGSITLFGIGFIVFRIIRKKQLQ